MKKGRIDVREKILDVAEKIFADSGIEGASIRDIVTAAKVNLATVYYYFGSKQGLFSAVMERRFGSVYKEQKENIKKIQAGIEQYSLEQILEAMLLPPLLVAGNDPSKGQIVRKLIGRIVTEPHKTSWELMRRRHKDLREAYLDLIHKKVPHLTKTDLQWRIEFIWGALAFLMCNPQKLEYMSDGLCNPSDTKMVLKQMLCFFAAGLKAPSVS